MKKEQNINIKLGGRELTEKLEHSTKQLNLFGDIFSLKQLWRNPMWQYFIFCAIGIIITLIVLYCFYGI